MKKTTQKPMTFVKTLPGGMFMDTNGTWWELKPEGGWIEVGSVYEQRIAA